MADLETFIANAAETTCDGALALAATTVVVVSTSAFSAVPFYATIDPAVDAKREVVRVTAKTATTLTVVRGQDGTSDVAHDSGAVVAQVPVGALWTDINDRVDAAVTSIATKADDADVVKLTGAQTIAGAKTFSTDPTLADGSSALSVTEGTAAYEALVSRTGATAGEVPTLQADNTLAFAAVGGGWAALTDADIVTVSRGSLQAVAGTSYHTVLDVVSGGAELLGGSIYGFSVGVRVTIDGTVVLTETAAARGGVYSATTATDDSLVTVIALPPMSADTSLKVELYNDGGGSRNYGWRVFTR